MGFFLTDSFTRTALPRFLEKRSEDYDGDGTISQWELNRAAALTACPTPNNLNLFPRVSHGMGANCPPNSTILAGVSYATPHCDCLCDSGYQPVVVMQGGEQITQCEPIPQQGCKDEFNENYDSAATTHRQSDCGDCITGYAVNPSSGFCELIENIPVLGCMDANARDYNSLATQHQGPCGPCNPNYARRELTAENADEIIWCEAGSCSNNSGTYTSKEVCESSGVCKYPWGDSLDELSGSYNKSACELEGGVWTPEIWTFGSESDDGNGEGQDECSSNEECDEGYICESGNCVEKIEGCTDPGSNEYNSSANVENGTCISCETGYDKDSDGLCTVCADGYTADAAGVCYEDDDEEDDFPWFYVAGIGVALVLVLR